MRYFCIWLPVCINSWMSLQALFLIFSRFLKHLLLLVKFFLLFLSVLHPRSSPPADRQVVHQLHWHSLQYIMPSCPCHLILCAPCASLAAYSETSLSSDSYEASRYFSGRFLTKVSRTSLISFAFCPWYVVCVLWSWIKLSRSSPGSSVRADFTFFVTVLPAMLFVVEADSKHSDGGGSGGGMQLITRSVKGSTRTQEVSSFYC